MLYLVNKNNKKLRKNEIFIIGSKNSLKLLEIGQILVKMLGSKPDVIPI